MEKKKKMGRPTKIPAEELKAIVQGYYITNGGENPDVMAAHNICAQLERYAADNGLRGRNGQPLRASDFRRSEIRGYIQMLADTARQDTTPISGVPAYERLDIQRCLNQSIKKQKESLLERENYYAMLHKRAAMAMSQYAALSERAEQLQAQTEELKTQNWNLQAEIEQMTHECGRLRKENADCRRYIRKYVDPERARNYLIEMRKDGPQTETLIDMAQEDVTIQLDKETATEDTIDQWGAIYDLFRDE